MASPFEIWRSMASPFKTWRIKDLANQSLLDQSLTVNRIFRYINVAFLALMSITAALAYWFLYRALPQTTGSVDAPVAAAATVTRDSLGVPHIRAATLDDVLFLQGYVTAQDRLWQMDALRRKAAGELAEFAGPRALGADQKTRALRLRRSAEEQSGKLPPADRAALAAFARGVNHFIETHRDAPPVEFRILGYDPRPWTIADSMLCGLEMYRSLTTTHDDDILKATMLQGVPDPAKVNFLFPPRSGGETQPGSNAWVVAGQRTATGKPILANDPHLQFGWPSTWYAVHLTAPGLDAAGVALPGLPGVIIGHNDRIAWGVTNLHFDVQDLYLENFDPNTGRYQFRNSIEQARLEREVIAVKGAPNQEMRVWVTRHGPVVPVGARLAALRWTAYEGYQYPFLELNQARNWQQFRKALSRFPGPGQNFVYADTDGNIGYQATGLLPLRHFDGSTPVPGAGGQFEWGGFIPFEDLPTAFNPPNGMIVTANQNPFPANYKHPVAGSFAPHYRSAQIRALLGERNGLTPQDMLAIQKDVYSAFTHFLAREIAAAHTRRKVTNPKLAEPIQLLKEWNGQMDKDQAAPLIATLTYQQLRKAAGDAAAPGRGALYEHQMAPAAIERLLRERPAGWFKDYDQVILKAFADAVEEASKLQGAEARLWAYGAYNRLLLSHPVLGEAPWVANWFRIGPERMSGSSTTVKQTTPALGPSMRFVADLANWDHSLLNLTLGQSGQPLSRHFRDQWTRYYAAESYTTPFRNPQGDVLRFVPSAKP
ncbi:MAG: penicillin acylase family protein [Acidobacteria bacterium]|nr:penicillin acylase family protein [Acidobacteriota bacterium]